MTDLMALVAFIALGLALARPVVTKGLSRRIYAMVRAGYSPGSPTQFRNIPSEDEVGSWSGYLRSPRALADVRADPLVATLESPPAQPDLTRIRLKQVPKTNLI